MKVSLVVNGAPREIEDGQGAAEIAAVEPGVYSVLMNGHSYEARIEQTAGGMVVFIEGHRFEIEVRDPRRGPERAGRPGVEGRAQVIAPMPGKIVRLLAAAGDTVAAGQGLLVVEAMKMQNEMKAPKAGRVASLAAREGATVAAGEVLAVIE